MNNLLGTVCWPTHHLSILSWVFMLLESYTRKPSMIYRDSVEFTKWRERQCVSEWFFCCWDQTPWPSNSQVSLGLTEPDGRAHSGAVGAIGSWNSNRELIFGTPNKKEKELAQNDTSLLKPHSQPPMIYIPQQGCKVTTASSQRATNRTPGIKMPETYQGKLTQATTMGNYRFYSIYGKTYGSHGGIRIIFFKILN